MSRAARAAWLGRRPYEPIHALQQELHEARKAGRVGDRVLLVEHDAVITLGRNADRAHVVASESELVARGVPVVPTGRGGDVTYHGPGQLVGYPILALGVGHRDVRRYVRGLAEVMILVAREHGVEAGTVDGLVGVWADAASPATWAGAAWTGRLAKLGAIGVRLSRWVTMHGFALNLTTAPTDFQLIVPCGIADHPVASIASLCGEAPTPEAVALGLGAVVSRCLPVAVGRVDDLSDAPLDELGPALGLDRQGIARPAAGASDS